MAYLNKSHQLNNNICIIPIVLQIYKNPDSSIGVIVQEPSTSREDAKIKNTNENETLSKTHQNYSKELNKRSNNEEISEKSQDHGVLKNEEKRKTKYFCKPLEKEYHSSKSSKIKFIKESTDRVQNGENYKMHVDYCDPEPESELNFKSYEDCSEISLDKIAQTSICLDDTDLQASQDSAFKSSTDLLDDEDPRLVETNNQKYEQILSLTDGSSIQIHTSGNNVILSKIKLEELNTHKLENASLNRITELYDNEMQSLHQKLKELKCHIRESKCPSMKCRRKLEYLTKQMLRGEGHQLDFILNRDKITSVRKDEP